MQHVLEIEEFYYKQQNFNVMARAKKTDQEKQEFIDLHFNEYKAVLGWNFDVNEWEKLDLEKQYRRVYDWVRRKENKEKEEAAEKEAELNKRINGFADRLKNIEDLTVLEMLNLKQDIDVYIDYYVRVHKDKEIAERKKELADFEAETQRQLKELETRRKAEKGKLEEQIKKIDTAGNFL